MAMRMSLMGVSTLTTFDLMMTVTMIVMTFGLLLLTVTMGMTTISGILLRQ